ncbi:PREDICTED: methylthioribose-1-phosphate isomerase-like isoform 2 [Fragaria vesca subsp. vesca]
MAPDSNFSDGIDSGNSLQAIRYNRGSLQLLDQTKLPLHSTYLNIRDSTDGWHAIKDMVVRGAPAIAIAAALSLAVEVFNLGDFNGTPDEASSFIIMKLEYLVSSRPTAVNLSDAATKLKQIVAKVAASASEYKSVFEAYIEASEVMLKEDVDTNKAIGSHGATFIQRHLENSKRICMLTHCNTGSLATAGYGTALGVIRSLHTEGVLERAYCTETRPFNQGSRLTAYELVHDNIPATLIADSAAAALMKDGKVNAIVVGADRVASNGDTANKIGEIVIEERSPKELLNTHGGLGEQVAASGISVWNPAFDVTPASLIYGIITEKGVITKKGTDAFDIKGFVQNA